MAKPSAALHNALDIALAQYLQAHPGSLPSETSVMQLLEWHYEKMAAEPSQVWADPASKPIPMILHCPVCHARHIDEGEFATKSHHSHACQNIGCGNVWRPALVPTVGVLALPGFKNDFPPRPLATSAVLVGTESGWSLHQIHRIEGHEVHDDGSLVLLVSPMIGEIHDNVEGVVTEYEAARRREAKGQPDGGA